MDKSFMENVKISVVIPAYNREALIRDAIESALDQTEKIDEIIVIDNDSSDRTFQIAQSYAETHNNVKVFKNEKNVGMMENWNRGVRKATGDYISLLHSDDIIPKNWCATVKSAIVKNQSKDVGLFFGIYACFEKKNGKQRVVSRIKNFPRDTFLKAKESLQRLWKNYYGNPNCSASIIYKREVFDVIGYFDPEKGTEADQHFHIRVLSVFNSYFIAQDLLYYRRHEFQAFDFKKEVESADTVIKRLLNAISIQKELLDSELVKYTYCGVLLYALKFLVTGKFKHACTIFRIPGIFNLRTLVNFPRFFWMLLYRKYSGDAVSFAKKFGVHIGFVSLCFIVLRHFLFGDYDSIGHNWDWGFPGMQFMFSRINELSLYSWNGFNLGRELNLQSHVIINEGISLLGALIGVKWSVVIIIFSALSIAFVSFKKLLDHINSCRAFFHYIPSLLYAFSPFLFNEIIGGSWYMWISYAFAPLLFLNLIKYLYHNDTKNFIGYLVTSFFVLVSLQNFVLIEIIIILFLVLHAIFRGDHGQIIKCMVIRYIKIHVVLFIINLYWIIPFINSLDIFYSMIRNTSFTGNFEGIRYITQNIVSISSLSGYLDRNMYYYAIPKGLLFLFNVMIIIFWLLIIVILFLKNKKIVSKNNIIIWLAILVFILLFIKGGNPPFEDLTMFIFQNFPLMSLYRSPQHLMFAAAFIIPLLMSFVLHYYIARGVSKKIVAGLGLCIVLFWTSAWWYNGDLGSKFLRNKSRDHIDFYTLSPALKNFYDHNENNFLTYRQLFLPTVFSPDYLSNEYQRKAQGGLPEYTHLKNPTFSAEFNAIADNIDNKFCYEKTFDLLSYLSIANVRYISLRDDIYPHHTKCGVFKLWNFNDVKNDIVKNQNLSSINDDENLYMVHDAYFIPRVFIPSKIIMADYDPKDIPYLVSSNYVVGTGIFLKGQNTDKIINTSEYIFAKKREGLIVEFKKINPTKYRVRLHGAQGTFPLVFSESFHDGWKAYVNQNVRVKNQKNNLKSKIGAYNTLDGNERDQASRDEVGEFIAKGLITNLGDGEEKEITHTRWDGEKRKEVADGVEKYTIGFISKNFHGTIQNDNLPRGKFWETWFKESLPEENHLMVNGYANSWVIDADDLCAKNKDFCVKNADGTYDMELVVEFWPQRLFYVGAFVSGLTLVGCLGYVGFVGVRSWRKKNVYINKQ